MNPTYRIRGLRRTVALLAALAAAWLLAGCVYRPDIQQGNLLQTDDVDQVKAGMTRSQVRYLLGTPMVSDPFEPNRWDYVYTYQRGRSKKIDRSHFVVYFDGDKVSRVEKLDLPEVSSKAQRIRQERAAKSAAEAAAPAPATPTPTAPSGTALPNDPPATTQPPGGG